ncbi:MAG: hypothetical protein DWQ01_03430 [Planctomycetota bacterium]|nr:MAG: hypothetical protein DWQ01_03430 [Planctomycetota bacterium]
MDESKKRRKTKDRRKGPWSHVEIGKLKKWFGLKSDREIAKDLRRSPDSVRRQARKVFAGEPRIGPWAAEDVQALKKYLGSADDSTLALILRRSEEEIRQKIDFLRSQVKEGPWSSEELQSLKSQYGSQTDSNLAITLGRTPDEIRDKARELCLAKDKAFLCKINGNGQTPMPRWSEKEKETLCRLYPDHFNQDIAKTLGRSVKSITSKANELGLVKSPSHLTDMGRRNVRTRYRS